MAGSFLIDGKLATNYGISLLRGTEKGATPSVKGKLEQVANRPGCYDFGAEYGEQKFTLKCMIAAGTRAEMLSNWREFVKLFDVYRYTNRLNALHQLVFDDEPDRYYNVRLDGKVSSLPQALQAEFSLPLVAADPFAYSVDGDWSYHDIDADPTIFTEYVGGNVPALPIWSLYCATLTTSDIVLLNSTSGQFITWEDGLDADDTLEVNTITGQVKKNGVIDMSKLAPGVNYPLLVGGVQNRIKLSGMIGVLTLDYIRRYL